MGESSDLVQRREEEEDASLREKSPMSQSEEDLEEEEAEIDREVFVDAPDSQYNPDTDNHLEDAGVQTDIQQLIRAAPIPMQTPTPAPKNRGIGVLGKPIAMANLMGTPAPGKEGPKESAADQKWRKRVEQNLMRMTAEVAALREQLEARRLFAHSAHYRLFRGIWRWVWAAFKHITVDVFLLGIVLLWMRRKKDRRLEGAIRVLLGDAVAQVQRGGGMVLGNFKLPRLGGKKSS
jgi:hypothetical protein